MDSTVTFSTTKKYNELTYKFPSIAKARISCEQWPSYHIHFPHHQHQPVVDNHGAVTNKFHQPFTLIMFPKPCFESQLLTKGLEMIGR